MNSNRSISILGCGWLGFELAISCIQEGFHVRGSTTSNSKIRQLKVNKIEPYLIDLSTDIETSAFFNSDILLLNIPPGRRNPDVQTNYPARISRALTAAKDGGVKHVILISSTGVFQASEAFAPEWSFPIITDDAPNADSNSANALIASEQLIQQSFGKNGTILRFGGLVGGNRLAGRFLAGKKDVQNGRAPVNMIHREDCIRIILAIIQKQAWGETFNASADLHPSRQAFYSQQASKYGFEAPTFINKDEAVGKIISNEALRQKLDYQFLHPDPLSF